MIGWAVIGLLVAGTAEDGGTRPRGLMLHRPVRSAQEAAEQQALVEYEASHGAAPDAGPWIPPFRWKIANILEEMPIDGVQMANDVPVKLHSLIVKGTREDVMVQILDHFRASGLYVEDPLKQNQPMRQLQITGLDKDRALSYSAMVDALPNGTCMVVLGEANLGVASYTGLMRKARKETINDFAPLMPGALAPFRTDVEKMHTLAFSVVTDEATAKKFYVDTFTRRGFTEVEPNLFRKAGEEITLTMKRETSRLDVLLTLRPSDPRL